MDISKPYLVIEVNDSKFNFLVIKYNENLDFTVIHSNSIKSEGILNGKVKNIKTASNLIRNNLANIEEIVGFTFKEATIVNDQNNYTCINVSGFKNLAGSQITKDDISFILNDLRKIISDSQPNKSLIHLFNSNFILDKNIVRSLPIGLHGEFYNQHLTFFLLPSNDLKNLKLMFNNCHISIERVISKNFAEGINFLSKNKVSDLLVNISINKKRSNISIFKNLSFVFSEDFPFGSDIIIEDVKKVCSLDANTVQNIFKNLSFNKFTNINNFIEKDFFKGNDYKKISLEHLNNIVSARIEELLDIIFKKNINIKYLNKNIADIYFSFEDENMLKNLQHNFSKNFSEKQKIIFNQQTQDELFKSCLGSAEIIGKGWEREAIPIIQTKKSIISRIFSSFFD